MSPAACWVIEAWSGNYTDWGIRSNSLSAGQWKDGELLGWAFESEQSTRTVESTPFGWLLCELRRVRSDVHRFC